HRSDPDRQRRSRTMPPAMITRPAAPLDGRSDGRPPSGVSSAIAPFQKERLQVTDNSVTPRRPTVGVVRGVCLRLLAASALPLGILTSLADIEQLSGPPATSFQAGALAANDTSTSVICPWPHCKKCP